MTPIMSERDGGTGQFLRHYVWTPAGDLLYMIDAADGNEVYFLHFDRSGSTLALTDTTGTVTDAYAYTPYGELLEHSGSSEQPFTFVGKWGVRREGASGHLYQMRARYYDAAAARFISRDPIWPTLRNPRGLNPYQYAYNTPITNVDSTGRAPTASHSGTGCKTIIGDNDNTVKPYGFLDASSLGNGHGCTGVPGWSIDYGQPACRGIRIPSLNHKMIWMILDMLGAAYEFQANDYPVVHSGPTTDCPYPYGSRGNVPYGIGISFFHLESSDEKSFLNTTYVDGVGGNGCRGVDLSFFFPEYSDENSIFNIDTTTYEDGVHTINFMVTDSPQGGAIGSRYFTINGNTRP
jgi:RHS repeat-associated protein